MIKLFFYSTLPTIVLLLPASAITVNAQSYQWFTLDGDGSPIERHENALVQAGDQFILIGGRGMKAVDLFDTQTGEWSQGAQPPFEIHHAQAVELDGLVYVAGALTGGWPFERPLSNILIYDPIQDVWELGPEIPRDRRRGATGVVVYEDKIYIVCGIINGHTSGWVGWLDEFDPASNKWRILPDAPRARDHLHAAVIGDQLLVSGGRRSGFEAQGFEPTVKETDIFDFTTNEWKTLPSPEGDLPTERAGTSAAVHEGKFLVIGGESGSQETAHNEVEALNPSTGTWVTLPHLIRGRHGTQAIYFDDMIVIGAGAGNRGGGPELTSFEIFAPEENPKISADPLIQSEITISTENLRFSVNEGKSSQSFLLESRHGNQAGLITGIHLDNQNDFDLQVSANTPFALAPDKKISIEVTWKGTVPEGSKASSNLLITVLGVPEPLNVVLEIVD